MNKKGTNSLESSQIGYEILTYLTEHPYSSDTVEGILRWWLLERKIEYHTVNVKKALAELVARGLILEHRGGDSQTLYRLNQHRHGEIQALLKQRTAERDLLNRDGR